jgi:hypothetical protein
MNTKVIKLPDVLEIGEGLKWPSKKLEPLFLMIMLVLLWVFIPEYIQQSDPRAGYLDPYLPALIILSMITFIVITKLCWWLLHRFWMSLGLPQIKHMVSQFKLLSPWQQLNFYWFSFVLLLLVALGCLSSIC